MEVPLVVILGAGASRGSADFARRLRPPLTIDLFDEGVYRDQLRAYDLAHQAGRFITQERKLDNALGLEQALHSLRTSEFDHHRQMALAVPPYLQELLHAVSAQHYSEAFRYDRLIERLLRIDFVCFITLNYDVLLDRRLNALHPLTTLDDYISRDKNWWLIKPHGSVNWFHPASQYFNPAAPPKHLFWEEHEYACELPTARLADIRNSQSGPETDRYPAIAMPEGPDDRLVMPNKHTEYLSQLLRAARQVDLLVIGYSGLDTKVLELLRSTNPAVRHLTIVDRDEKSAFLVLDRLRNRGLASTWKFLAPGDFADWTDGGGLDALVDEYDGPYPRSS